MKRFIAVLLLVFAVDTFAADLEGFRVLRISAPEQVAVIRSLNGSLQLVRVGDRVGEDLVVEEIGEDLVVLQQPGPWGPVRLQIVVRNGAQEVMRMERRPLEGVAVSQTGEGV